MFLLFKHRSSESMGDIQDRHPSVDVVEGQQNDDNKVIDEQHVIQPDSRSSGKSNNTSDGSSLPSAITNSEAWPVVTITIDTSASEPVDADSLIDTFVTPPTSPLLGSVEQPSVGSMSVEAEPKEPAEPQLKGAATLRRVSHVRRKRMSNTPLSLRARSTGTQGLDVVHSAPISLERLETCEEQEIESVASAASEASVSSELLELRAGMENPELEAATPVPEPETVPGSLAKRKPWWKALSKMFVPKAESEAIAHKSEYAWPVIDAELEQRLLHMSHMKLMDARRGMYKQVLISNVMSQLLQRQLPVMDAANAAEEERPMRVRQQKKKQRSRRSKKPLVSLNASEARRAKRLTSQEHKMRLQLGQLHEEEDDRVERKHLKDSSDEDEQPLGLLLAQKEQQDVPKEEY